MHHRFFFPACLLTVSAGFCLPLPRSHAQQSTPAGLTQYLFGSPSGDEAEMLCEINRARANPPAEGQRLVAGINPANYGIGRGGSPASQQLYYATIQEITASFNGYPARPPLAFNALLNASAQAHVADMIATGVQQHNSSDGTSARARVMSFGYSAFSGENIAGTPYDDPPFLVPPWDTEAAYETDITNAEPGIGHRLNIMEPSSPPSNVEVGIAHRVLGGWDTEDFGRRSTPPLLTGVVFTDNAGTGFYASGEGVSGVTVTAPGLSSYYAVTGRGGAYTLPLDLAGPVYTLGEQYYYDANTGKFVYSPLNPAPQVSVTFTDAQGNATTRTVTLTHTETTDPGAADPATGYTGVGSAYFDASGTPRWDNAQVDLVAPATGGYSLTPLYLAFFLGETDLSEGVRYLVLPNGNIFGYYSVLADTSYLYHFDLGFEYLFDANDGRSGVYLYDFASQTFFYTSPSFPFPYLYDFSLNSVLYYYPDPNNPGRYNTDGVRYFYDFASGKIISK